jgi:hypothetical protein
MIEKLAYNIEMAFDIPDTEKEMGIIAVERLNDILAEIDRAMDHINILYVPFEKNQNVSTESLVEKRGVLNRFKQQVKDNFSKVKAKGLFVIESLNNFSSDFDIKEIVSSFEDSISEVESQVEILMKILDDYRSPDFRESILSSIKNLKKQVAQVERLIKDRIIEHINANILAKNWVSTTGKDLNFKIQNKVPLVTQLYNARQKALESPGMVAIEKKPQALNPSDAESMQYPDDLSPKTTMD